MAQPRGRTRLPQRSVVTTGAPVDGGSVPPPRPLEPQVRARRLAVAGIIVVVACIAIAIAVAVAVGVSRGVEDRSPAEQAPTTMSGTTTTVYGPGWTVRPLTKVLANSTVQRVTGTRIPTGCRFTVSGTDRPGSPPRVTRQIAVNESTCEADYETGDSPPPAEPTSVKTS